MAPKQVEADQEGTETEIDREHTRKIFVLFSTFSLAVDKELYLDKGLIEVEKILCRLLYTQLLAEEDSDEVYAQIT